LSAPRDEGTLPNPAPEPHEHGGVIMPRWITGALACGLTMAAALGASLPAWGQGTTERVSVGPNGRQSNDESWGPVLSADGRFAAFTSDASNLVSDDTNGTYDVFVHDRRTGKTERVSLGQRDVQGNGGSFDPALSADGRFAAFYSSADNLVQGDMNSEADVFVHTR
jgi:hypothetical protein